MLYKNHRKDHSFCFYPMIIIALIFIVVAIFLETLYVTGAISIIDFFSESNYKDIYSSVYTLFSPEGEKIFSLSSLIIAITFSIFFEILLRLLDKFIKRINGESFFYCAGGQQLRAFVAAFNLLLLAFTWSFNAINKTSENSLLIYAFNMGIWSLSVIYSNDEKYQRYDDSRWSMLNQVDEAVKYMDIELYNNDKNEYSEFDSVRADQALSNVIRHLITMEYIENDNNDQAKQIALSWQNYRSRLHSKFDHLDFQESKLLVSKKIQELRRNNNIKINDLLILLDIDIDTYIDYETGALVPKSVIKKLSKFYNVPVSYIRGEDQ